MKTADLLSLSFNGSSLQTLITTRSVLFSGAFMETLGRKLRETNARLLQLQFPIIGVNYFTSLYSVFCIPCIIPKHSSKC